MNVSVYHKKVVVKQSQVYVATKMLTYTESE